VDVLKVRETYIIFIYLFIDYLLIYLFKNLFNYIFIHPFIYLFIYLFIPPLHKKKKRERFKIILLQNIL